MSDAARTLDVRRLGRTRYEDVHRLQGELVEQRIAGEVGQAARDAAHALDRARVVGRIHQE